MEYFAIALGVILVCISIVRNYLYVKKYSPLLEERQKKEQQEEQEFRKNIKMIAEKLRN